MPHRVCPWWLGYFLLNPFRKRRQNPHAILSPYVREGTTVLEPGPGMGFFTAELAKLVGASSRVICVDVQSKMIDKLKRRLAKLKLNGRVDARLALPDSMGLADLRDSVQFILPLRSYTNFRMPPRSSPKSRTPASLTQPCWSQNQKGT